MPVAGRTGTRRDHAFARRAGDAGRSDDVLEGRAIVAARAAVLRVGHRVAADRASRSGAAGVAGVAGVAGRDVARGAVLRHVGQSAVGAGLQHAVVDRDARGRRERREREDREPRDGERARRAQEADALDMVLVVEHVTFLKRFHLGGGAKLGKPAFF